MTAHILHFYSMANFHRFTNRMTDANLILKVQFYQLRNKEKGTKNEMIPF